MKRQLLLTVTQEEYSKIPELMADGWLVDPILAGDRPIKLDHALVWPLVYYESSDEVPKPPEPVVKPGEFADVIASKDVQHVDVEDYVKEGFEVFNIFQKNVIMVKRKPKTSPQPPGAVTS